MPTRAIRAIFYTRFHHERGSRVLHQVPPGAITPSSSPSALPAPLFPFTSITQYLIPTQQFCDRLLTFCVNHHRVIGYPVCIREGKYSRNEFIFNFAIVIGENETDWACYGEVVRKLGKLLRGLEEQGGFLSGEEEELWEDEGVGLGLGDSVSTGGFGTSEESKVHALCEMVMEDLNNYAECMIPIDDSNTINLKLFPTRAPPPPVKAHQVPLLTMSLSSLQTPISSDLTLNSVLPFINGVNSISRIATLADTDLSLTRRAVQHLVYYGCLVLLDIFSFSAIYAPTAEIGSFIADDDVKDECIRYISVPPLRGGSTASKGATVLPTTSESERSRNDRPSVSSSASQQSLASSNIKVSDYDAPSTTSHAQPAPDAPPPPHHPPLLDYDTLVMLYTSLRQGLALKSWVLANHAHLTGIDIRRFITFGIIKGFLYRVHKYAVATASSAATAAAAAALPPAPPTSLQTSAATSTVNLRDSDTATLRGAPYAHYHTQHHHHAPSTISIHHRPSIAAGAQLPQQLPQQLTQQQQPAPVLANAQHHASVSAAGGRPAELQAVDALLSARERDTGVSLQRFLDGCHCFDEICSELGVPEKVVAGKMRGSGGEGMGVVVHR